MLWSIDTCQNKISAGQYHVTISRAQVYSSLRSRVLLKLTSDQVLIFYWIAGSYQLNVNGAGLFGSRITLTQDYRVKVNQSINIPCIQIFFTASVLCILRLLKLNIEGQTIYKKTSLQRYKTQIKILA